MAKRPAVRQPGRVQVAAAVGSPPIGVSRPLSSQNSAGTADGDGSGSSSAASPVPASGTPRSRGGAGRPTVVSVVPAVGGGVGGVAVVLAGANTWGERPGAPRRPTITSVASNATALRVPIT
jgi:hypothetical protein